VVLLMSVLALSGSSRGQGLPKYRIDPPNVTVATGGAAVQFLLIPDLPGPPPAAEWRVNERVRGYKRIGTISKTGLYQPPPDLPQYTQTVTIDAFLNGEIVASANVVIVAGSCLVGGPACVQIRPAHSLEGPVASRIVTPGSWTTFIANSLNPVGSAVLWTINDSKEGDGTIGTILQHDNSVDYRAPASVLSVTVNLTATLISNSSINASVQIIVAVNRVAIRRPSPRVGSKDRDQFVLHCSSPLIANNSTGCRVKNFDRLVGETGKIAGVDVGDQTPAGEVTAVNSSKTLFSGSLLSIDLPQDQVSGATCPNYDWKLIVQAAESATIVIYDPSDVGPGVCEGNNFIIALPVHVVWADVSGFQQIADPTRTPPAKPTSFTDCQGVNGPQTIVPCDRFRTWAKIYYNWRLIPFVYRHLSPAGTVQATLSLTPVIGEGSDQASYDILADPSLMVRKEWLNIPLTFEKTLSSGSNLDALIIPVAYDFRWLANPNFKMYRHVQIRKPQVQIRSGVEIAPTTPHDVNVVESEIIKFPFAFTFHQQPSIFTIYPVLGMDEGSHVNVHMDGEHDSLLRGLAGVDGSFRWPFNFTHNFFGANPATIDFTYRERWLAYDEPTTNFAVSSTATETLSHIHHAYMRGALNLPLNPYLQFQTTFLKGSLPPDFRVITTTLTVGLTFTNPGSAEH
jgi:hypothetical protein